MKKFIASQFASSLLLVLVASSAVATNADESPPAYVEKAVYKSNEPNNYVNEHSLLELEGDRVAVLKNKTFVVLDAQAQRLGGFEITAPMAQFRAFERLGRNRILAIDSEGTAYVTNTVGQLEGSFSLDSFMSRSDRLFSPLPSGNFYVLDGNVLKLYDSTRKRKICELYPESVRVPFGDIERMGAISIFSRVSDDNQIVAIGESCNVIQRFDVGPALEHSYYARALRCRASKCSMFEQNPTSAWSKARVRLFDVTSVGVVLTRDIQLPVSYRVDQIEIVAGEKIIAKHDGMTAPFNAEFDVFDFGAFSLEPSLAYSFSLPTTFFRLMSHESRGFYAVGSDNDHSAKIYRIEPTGVAELYSLKSEHGSVEVMNFLGERKHFVATPVGAEHDVVFLAPR